MKYRVNKLGLFKKFIKKKKEKIKVLVNHIPIIKNQFCFFEGEIIGGVFLI